MTRPKADTDPWLTDPVSRDRVIAKTVVEGMRQIVVLLRTIRDEAADESRQLRRENARLRDELIEMYRSNGHATAQAARRPDYPVCLQTGCSLPDGHPGNHRGKLSQA